MDRSRVFEADGRSTVPLVYAGGATVGVTPNSAVWQADIGYAGVVYAITDKGVARAEFTELPQLADEAEIKSQMPDPVESGEFVLRF